MGDIGQIRTNWKGSAHLAGNAADRSAKSVARVLRNARLLQGYDLEEVANALNIRASHLEALEDGRFADLPPLVYAQGFVSSYAGFLELDKNELVNRFRDEATGAPTPLPTIAQFNLNTEPDAAERRIPSFAVVVAGFLLVALAYGLWQATLPGSQRDEILAVPPLPSRFAAEAFTTMPAPVLVTPPPAAPAETTTPDTATPAQSAAYTGPGVITLRVHQQTWAQFTNLQGQRVSRLMLRAGTTYSIPASYSGYTATFGNLAGVAILVDGQVTQQPAADGITTVTLDAPRLMAGTAVQSPTP